MLELSQQQFERVCREILAGLGMRKANVYRAPGVHNAYRVEINRESSDKMFRTEESWICMFQRAQKPIDAYQILAISSAAIAANVRQLFLVVFGSMSHDARQRGGRDHDKTSV